MRKRHYIAMAGLAGYLPNVCQSFERKADAIDFLCEVHDNQRGLRSDLRKYDYSNHCPGNEYCEIVVCTCDDSTVHNDL